MVPKTLRILCEHFADEVDGVIEYVGDAMTVKKHDPDLAKAYLEMARQEYDHASKAHQWACKYMDMACAETDSEMVHSIFEDKKQHMMKELTKAKTYLEVYGGK